MDLPLHPESEAILRRKVEAGEYPSMEALVEEALFLLVERDWRKSQADLLEKVPSAIAPAPETQGDSNLHKTQHTD